MPKNYCVVGCSNVFIKGCGLQFYHFPVGDGRKQWIAAIGRKDWTPTEYLLVCSKHFVTGLKSNDPLAPNYIAIFLLFLNVQLCSSFKRNLESRAVDLNRRQAIKNGEQKLKQQQLEIDVKAKRLQELAEEKKQLEEEKEQRKAEEEKQVRRDQKEAQTGQSFAKT